MIPDAGDRLPRPAPEDAQPAARADLDALLPAIYDELRRIAHTHLSRERAGHTLNTTSLVHESYLRLAGIQAVDWSDRSRFLGMASRAMRRVLIDYARARMRQKRSAAPDVITIEAPVALPVSHAEDLLTLDAALARLEDMQPRQCRVVECRFFGGMTNDETADALAISAATVKRDWTLARAWLNAELASAGVPGLHAPNAL